MRQARELLLHTLHEKAAKDWHNYSPEDWANRPVAPWKLKLHAAVDEVETVALAEVIDS